MQAFSGGSDDMNTKVPLSQHYTPLFRTIYSTFNRIDRIAALFEECGDPWGLFPTAYRHITRRIIKAIDGNEIPGDAWGRAIVLDFASRYFEALRLALLGRNPLMPGDSTTTSPTETTSRAPGL